MSEETQAEDQAPELSLEDRRDALTKQIEDWKANIYMARGYIQCLDELMEKQDPPTLDVVKEDD